MTAKKTKKVNRATFGSVRKLPSGRFQARYPDEHGAPMTGPETYVSAEEAWSHIAEVRADRKRHKYTDHRKGARLLSSFAREWIDNGGSRGHLAIKTRELYDDILARQIEPTIGSTPIGKLTPPMVRTWHTALGKSTGPTRRRQCYALLKSIMNTALGDGLIGSNPCTIKGAGIAKAPKREFMSVAEFSAMLENLPARLHAPLIVAVTAHLRPGELVALERRDLDLNAGTLRVERQHIRTRDGQTITTPTKTGNERTVDLPDIALDALRKLPKALPKSPLFVRADGSALTVHGMRQQWDKARAKLGLKHTLYSTKHLGLTLAAQRGATVEELRQIAGHSTTAAASAYQLFARERGRVIADGLDEALAPLRALEG